MLCNNTHFECYSKESCGSRIYSYQSGFQSPSAWPWCDGRRPCWSPVRSSRSALSAQSDVGKSRSRHASYCSQQAGQSSLLLSLVPRQYLQHGEMELHETVKARAIALSLCGMITSVRVHSVSPWQLKNKIQIYLGTTVTSESFTGKGETSPLSHIFVTVFPVNIYIFQTAGKTWCPRFVVHVHIEHIRLILYRQTTTAGVDQQLRKKRNMKPPGITWRKQLTIECVGEGIKEILIYWFAQWTAWNGFNYK